MGRPPKPKPKPPEPDNPHEIFPLLEETKVASIQLRGPGNRKMSSFVGGVPLKYVRDSVAAEHGAGFYSLAPLDERGKPAGEFVPLEVTQAEAAAAQADMMQSAGKADNETFAYAHAELVKFREIIEQDKARIEEREEKLREQIQEHQDDLREQSEIQEQEYRDRMETLEDEYREKKMALEEERSGLYEGILERQQELLNDAQERADIIIEKAESRAERIIENAREEAAEILAKGRRQQNDLREELDEIKQRERDVERREREVERILVEERAKLERERLQHEREMDKKELLQEMNKRLDKASSNQSPYSQKVMDEMARAQIRRAFPEESEFEKIMRQLAPLLGGMPPAPGMDIPDMGGVEVTQIPAPDLPPALMDMPDITDLPPVDEQIVDMPPVGTNPYEDAEAVRAEIDAQEAEQHDIPPISENEFDSHV